MSALRLPAPKAPGRCRHCGCTENIPCRLGRYLTCSWVVGEGDDRVCSKRECMEKEIARLWAKVDAIQKPELIA